MRLIQKWLKVDVLEDGERTRVETGTVQGWSVSPLLANVYLHYLFDLWGQRWRRTPARGHVIVARFADHFAVGFEHRHKAEQFLRELGERFSRFGLELHPNKTRLIARWLPPHPSRLVHPLRRPRPADDGAQPAAAVPDPDGPSRWPSA